MKRNCDQYNWVKCSSHQQQQWFVVITPFLGPFGAHIVLWMAEIKIEKMNNKPRTDLSRLRFSGDVLHWTVIKIFSSCGFFFSLFFFAICTKRHEAKMILGILAFFNFQLSFSTTEDYVHFFRPDFVCGLLDPHVIYIRERTRKILEKWTKFPTQRKKLK